MKKGNDNKFMTLKEYEVAMKPYKDAMAHLHAAKDELRHLAYKVGKDTHAGEILLNAVDTLYMCAYELNKGQCYTESALTNFPIIVRL